MSLRDRLDRLRDGAAGKPVAPVVKEKRERVGPFRYVREVRDELVKVTWPKRKQVVRGTVQVLVVSLIFIIVLGGLDMAFQFGLKQLIQKDEAAPVTETTDTVPEAPTEPAAEVPADNSTQ